MGVAKQDIIEALRGGGVLEFLARAGVQFTEEIPGRDYRFACPWGGADCGMGCGVFTRTHGALWLVKCLKCSASGDIFTLAGMLSGRGDAADPRAFASICEWMGGVLGVAAAATLTPEEEAKRRAELDAREAKRREVQAKIAHEAREKAIAEAVAMRDQAARHPDRSIAAAYFTGRGVRLDELPEDARPLPESILFHPACYRRYYTGEVEVVRGGEAAKVTREERVPAVVGVGVDWRGEARMVQRIFLDPESLRAGGDPYRGGARKITYGETSRGKRLDKQALGTGEGEGGGVSVRLRESAGGGTLVLCEGIETGMAIQAAMGELAAVWATISAEGLRAFRLHPVMLDPAIVRAWLLSPIRDDADMQRRAEWAELVATTRGWVKKVIVAGDLDRSKTGQKASARCASNLLEQWGDFGLAVDIALPTHDVAPHLVAADGSLID